LLCSTAVLIPATAHAQSTGTVAFEEQTIVITGKRQQDVGGVETPDTPKSRVVLNQEAISRANPGQTILDTINLVPGVSFQNNDAYGSAGGTLSIRGFDSSRISLTFDGIQLNDSGNYAIFSNQMLDPELIEQVNVTLGQTDVDSPTASAVGGTVNFRTMTPTAKMGGRVIGSGGYWDFRRLFGLFNTGEIGPLRTRMFVSGSITSNHIPYNNYGKIDKKQVNARIWQPVGANGDFVSIAGHYNQNRNNFFGSLPLRTDTTGNRVVGPNSQNRYPRNRGERFYDINWPCAMDVPTPGVRDTEAPGIDPETGLPSPQFASCGTEFDRRYNPSNTGNIRGSSKFTITDNVVLTVDPSVQFVKANGGGTVFAEEGLRDINPARPPDPDGAGPLPRPPATATVAECAAAPNNAFNTCVPGYLGGTPFFGRDINGDGDELDRVTVLAPSQTKTFRPGVIANLRWDINSDHILRFSYTLDWARHRQTGEVGLLENDGEPEDVFPINDPQEDALGVVLQKRDRKSYAILNRFAGEWIGNFGPVTVNAGLAAPFFVRKLQNFCFTSSASGFVECFGQDATREAQFATLNPTIQGPQKRKFKYDKLLPNLGAVYDITPQLGIFASYAKGLSVPSTDNLYNSFFFPVDTPEAKPDPETTDSFDAGVRYRTGRIQAQVSGWFTRFENRIVSAFDPELNQSVFRNLGRVDKYGIDGSVAYEPNRHLTLYLFGSWMKSKIKDNIQLGIFGTGAGRITDCDNIPTAALPSDIIRSCAFTAGNRESGSPNYTFGGSAVGRIADLELGVTAKRTGPRFIFDNARPMFSGTLNNLDDTNPNNDPVQIFPNKAPAYWLVNLDARYSLRRWGPELKGTYLQLNVYNLFDKFYIGGFGGGLSQALASSNTVFGNPPFVQIGAPRTVMASLNIGF
jgi:iron complex outermembrane receptor protein